jgi:glucosyl-dolichyl phosphate glucuronosyltransferase
MLITVVVCTYNRCGMLKKALESIAACELPPHTDWEVLVVDNNSADETHQVVEDFRARFPGRFRYALEKRQGLSFARNAGIEQSLGEILAFTDDDVTVDPMWLANLAGALRDRECSAVGGRVRPLWGCAPPPWFPRKFSTGVLVEFDHGPAAAYIGEPPFGANMAFRKEMFQKYGDFRADLGRSGNNTQCNEDTEFGRRLLLGGERIRYEPAAVVYHPVPEDRLTKKYFRSWWYGRGVSDVKRDGISPKENFLIAGVPAHLFRRLVACTMRSLLYVGAERRFNWQINAAYIAGLIVGSRQWSRRPTGRASLTFAQGKPTAENGTSEHSLLRDP